MLNESRIEFDKFKADQFAKGRGISEYEAELGKLLFQLRWLVNRARLLHVIVVESSANGLSNLNQTALDELEIITESFYYFVGRLAEVFKKSARFKKLPRNEAEMIRHRLLQHPEEQKELAKGHPVFSFGSLENGPTIKSYVGPQGSQEDRGLYVNAAELDAIVAATIRQGH